MKDQAQNLREMAKARTGVTSEQKSSRTDTPRKADLLRCRSIAVTSGKGGVGKTNISLFLAIALAATKKRVLLLDADLGLANVHILLGIAPKWNIAHLIAGECGVEDVITAGPGGIDIIPGASGLEELANLDIGRIEWLRRELVALEKRYDILVIDTGAGIGTVVTQFVANADLTLLVLTPEPTSLADAYAMVKVLDERGMSRIGVVVNMAISDADGSETFDRLNAIVVKFLRRSLDLFCVLPAEKEIGRHVRRQRVFTVDNPGSRFAGRMQGMARRVCGVQHSRHTGFFARFMNRFAPDTRHVKN